MLCVIVVHVGTAVGFGDPTAERFLVHTNIGVTIFFLVSGFLLYRPFIAHRAGGPPAPAMADYGWRRCLRIFPAWWLVLTAVILIPGLTATGGSLLPHFALLFTLSGDPATGWGCNECSLTQTWSLVVELTFYASLPLYVVAANRLAHGRPVREWLRTELLLLGALSLASMILTFFLFQDPQPRIVTGSLLAFVLWFALGMALALVSVASEASGVGLGALNRVRAHPAAAWLAAFVIYVGLALFLPTSPFLLSKTDLVIGFLGFGAVAALVMAPAALPGPSSSLPASVLGWRVLSWLGLISYGLFLWHSVALRAVRELLDTTSFPVLLVATVALTTVIAAISYYALERPILRLKNSRPRRRAGPSRRARSATT